MASLTSTSVPLSSLASLSYGQFGGVPTVGQGSSQTQAVAAEDYQEIAREWLVGSVSPPAKIHGTTGVSEATTPTSSELHSATPHPNRSEPVLGLKKWSGVILEIEDQVLSVELTPLDHEGPVLLADFELALLAPDDSSVEPGDVVYLTTRYVRARSGYRTVTTELRLRRLGRWSQEDLTAIRERAAARAASLKKHVD